jgi:hypothetical protein
MGIASFSPTPFRTPGLSMLLAPVHALLALFMPVQPAQASLRASVHSPAPRFPNVSGVSSTPSIVKRTPGRVMARPVSRLKVMREFEPGAHRSQAGRMVISGRMADVCAELDRIAQREACTL